MDVRGECGFSSLMKQKKKAKICFVIYIPEKDFFFIYDVIVKQNKSLRCRLYYLHACHMRRRIHDNNFLYAGIWPQRAPV